MNKRKHLLAGALLASLGLTGGASATDYDFSLDNLQLFDTTGGGMTLVTDYSSFTGTSYVAGIDVSIDVSNLSAGHVGLGGFGLDLVLGDLTANGWTAGAGTSWFANFDGGGNTNDLANVGGAVGVGVVTSSALLGTAYVDIADPAAANTTVTFANLSAGAVNGSDQLLDVIAVSDDASIVIKFPDDVIIDYAGDANRSGFVDGSDFAILAGNWQTSGKVWEDGDFNGDGNVDGSDFALLAGNWQTGPAAAVAAIPEPASIAMLGLGGLAMLRRRK